MQQQQTWLHIVILDYKLRSLMVWVEVSVTTTQRPEEATQVDLNQPTLIVKHQPLLGSDSREERCFTRRLGSFQRNAVHRHGRLFINFTHRDQCVMFKQPPRRLTLNIKHFNPFCCESSSRKTLFTSGQTSFMTDGNSEQTRRRCWMLVLDLRSSFVTKIPSPTL